jgi:hypothetical protein
MLIRMLLSSFLRVMSCVRAVSVCDVGMVRRFFVVACFMMFRGLAVMLRGMLVMICSFFVVVSAFMGHGKNLLSTKSSWFVR